MITEQTASNILAKAADTLTEEEWTQGNYFEPRPIGNDEYNMCRCAHGQIQWCVKNADIQQQIKDSYISISFKKSSPSWFIIPIIDTPIGIAFHLGEHQVHSGHSLQEWLSSLRRDNPQFNQALFLAHYYAVRVGLTTSYNDVHGRTFTEIIAKLREASLLALSEGN